MSLLQRVTGNIVTLHGADARLRAEIAKLKRDKRRTDLQTVDPRMDGMPMPMPMTASEPVLVEIVGIGGGVATGRRLAIETVVTESGTFFDYVIDEDDEQGYTILLYPFGLRAFIGCRCEIVPFHEHRVVTEESTTVIPYWRVLKCEGDGFRAFIVYEDEEEIGEVLTGPYAGAPIYPWSQQIDRDNLRPHELDFEKEVGPEGFEAALGLAMWFAPGFDAQQSPRKVIPSGTPVTIRNEPTLGPGGGYAGLCFTEVIEPESQVC